MTSQGSSRENPEDKRERLEAELLSRAISDSIEVQSVYDNKRRFSTFEQFLKCNEQNKVSNFWDVLRRENCVIYINLITVNIVELAYSVVVTDNLLLSVHYKGTEVKSLGSKYKFPLEVSNINVVHDILELIEQMELAPFSNISSICDVIQSALLVLRDKLEEKDTLLQFMSSQVELVQQKKERFRYSSDTIIFSSLLYFLSPHAYKFIRHSGNIILPHPSTIRKVCSSYDISPHMEQNDNNFLGYIKDKVTTLKSQECSVVLMVDEVHIKQYIDYKGDNIVGMAFDNMVN